jgi:hypothetical protein
VTQFHVGDPATPTEVILVTDNTTTSWAVTRGAEGSTPVEHAPGFTIAQVVTAGWLGGVSFVNPMTSPGDMVAGTVSGVAVRVPGNTTTTKEFLTQTGTAGTANAPVWGTIASADVPTLNQNTTGTSANVTGTVATTHGGTGLVSVTAYEVVTGGVTSTSALQTVASTGTSGQVLTSQGAGSLPTWTSNVGGTVPVPVTVGGTGGTQATAYTLVTGGTSATSKLQSLASAGTAGQILTSNGAGVPPSWQANSGGGTVAFPITVPEGGTGGTAVTAYAIVAGGTASTSPFQQVASVGGSGQVLTSQGAGLLPQWATNTGGSVSFPVTVNEGGTGGTTATAYSVITGGTGSTSAFQQVSGLGNSGMVLTSNGAAALPSWQANTPGSGVTLIQPSGSTAGTTDLTAVQSALNATGFAWLAKGNFWFNAPCTLPTIPANSSPGGVIRGQGETYTTIFQQNGTADTFNATDAKNLSVENINITCNVPTGSGNGIALYQATGADTTYVNITNVKVFNPGGDGIRIDQPIVGRIANTLVSGANGNGFNINVQHLATGTSFSFENCYAIGCSQAGYAMYQMHYCSFVSTATDGCGIGYYLNNCNSVSFLAAGTESQSQNSGIYAGHGYYIDGGADITLIDPLVNECPNIAFYVTGSAQNIRMIHPFQTGTGAVAGTAALFCDTGSYVTLERPDFGNNTSGTITGTGTIVGLGGVYEFSRFHDTFDRFNVLLTGACNWGAGTIATDTNLYRGAANVLQTDDSLQVGTHALGQVQPNDQNLVAWSYDPALIVGGATATAGTQYLSGLYVNQSTTVSNIYWTVGTGAGTATANQSFVGLVSSNGHLVNASAAGAIDSVMTSSGLKTTAVAGTVTPGFYWVVFLFNFTGTALQLGRATAFVAAVPNVGLTNATYRFATCGTAASMTNLNNFPITPSSNGILATTFWAGIG